MYDNWFSPLHLLILISAPFMLLGLPIYLGIVIVRKVKKKYPSSPKSTNH